MIRITEWLPSRAKMMIFWSLYSYLFNLWKIVIIKNFWYSHLHTIANICSVMFVKHRLSTFQNTMSLYNLEECMAHVGVGG